MTEPKDRSKDPMPDLDAAAWHEAAHAVLDLHYCIPIAVAFLEPDEAGNIGGGVLLQDSWHHARWLEYDDRHKLDFERLVTVVGGEVGQVLRTGFRCRGAKCPDECEGQCCDEWNANKIAWHALDRGVATSGMTDSEVDAYMETRWRPAKRDARDTAIDRAKAEALHILTEERELEWAAIQAALIDAFDRDHGCVLTPEEVQRAFDGARSA